MDDSEADTVVAEPPTTAGSSLGARSQVGATDLLSALPGETADELESHYELGERLGIGGMGEVLRCRDIRIGRDVAMKRLLPGETSDAMLRRFLREARVQGRLQHPSIVPVHDLGTGPDGQPYFVMKRIRGRTLSEILGRIAKGDLRTEARFNRRRLLSAFAQACLALDYAHGHGVVHRDLKPGNLMLGDFGELYVLDWGVAHIEGADGERGDSSQGVDEDSVSLDGVALDATEDGAVLGTIGYAAPEQCRGRSGVVGPAADIYAMGVVLYELLTRRRLFGRGDSLEYRMERTLSGIDAVPSSVDPTIAPELDAIVRKATQLDPRRRYASMRTLHDAVEAFLAGQRNEELRAQMADEHARKAERAMVERGSARAVLRDIGRSLALGRERTLELFEKVVDQPSEEAVGEVERQLVAVDEDRYRRAMRAGIVNYALWFLMLPILVAMGIHDSTVIGTGAVTIGAATLACAVFGYRGRVRRWQLYLVLVLNLVALGAATRVFGPLMFVPQILLATSFSFSLVGSTIDRGLFLGLALLTVLVPFALEAAGLWQASYAFDATGLRILPNALGLPEGPTTALLVAVTVVNLIGATLFCSQVRHEIDRVQRHSLLQRWHLEHMFGIERVSRPPSADGDP